MKCRIPLDYILDVFFFPKKLYPILYQLRYSYFFYNIIFDSFCPCGHFNKLERGSVITL